MENKIDFKRKKDLILPEYGRNIQSLVEYAVGLESKEERTACAYTIVDIMGSMFPYLRDVDGFKYKLWDHLAVMSDFKLDIDYPFDIIKQDGIVPKPSKLPYTSTLPKYRHYGKVIEQFIIHASKLEDKEKQDNITHVIGNYMKKSLLDWNKEVASDSKVISDLKKLSKDKLDIKESEVNFLSLEDYSKTRQQRRDNSKKKRKRSGKY